MQNLGLKNRKDLLMTRDEVLSKLATLKPDLNEKYGIEKFALFGSYARNEAEENSDVDIVILKMKKKDLAKRLAAKEFLQTKLNKNIDIGYLESMKTFIKNRIKKELIYV